MTHSRVGKIADVENISLVFASSWKSAYRGIVQDGYLDALKDNHWVEYLTLGLNSGSVFSMVIENNREIMGAAILSQTEKAHEANLISFYLLPDKIGQGFGHLFYSAIESELRGRGFLHCLVDVLENNTRAIRFYESHGFVDTGKTSGTTLGERNYTCKVFEKAL